MMEIKTTVEIECEQDLIYRKLKNKGFVLDTPEYNKYANKKWVSVESLKDFFSNLEKESVNVPMFKILFKGIQEDIERYSKGEK